MLAQDFQRPGLERLVYDELRRLARYYLSWERSMATLQPTELVHEAYLRLCGQHSLDWTNRAQIIGIGAHMMRRILLNHARAKKAAKRSAEPNTILIEGCGQIAGTPAVDVIDLHRALQRLGQLDATQERIVELRFFGGLSLEETAGLLSLPLARVKRDWATARLFLLQQMRHGAPIQP